MSKIWRSKSGRLFLLFVVLLAPFALGVAIYWKFTKYQTREFATETGRAKVIRIANEFLNARGIEGPKEWNLEFDEDLEFLTYIHRKVGERQTLPPIGSLPGAPAVIRLKEKNGGADAIEISVGPSGRVLSYNLPLKPADGGPGEADRESAVSAARPLLSGLLLDPEEYILSAERVYEQTDSKDRRILRVEWTATSRELPELSFSVRFGYAGASVFSQFVSADVDDAYMASGGPMVALKSFIGLVSPIYVIALIVYMMVRYVQRSLEKEVSHGRAIVVAVYIMAMVSTIFLVGDQNVVFNVEVGDNAPGAVLIFVYFFFALMALLAGMCYAACEGDVRERFMGSLSSFDALLTGRVFSRNVARAFVAGFIGAAWLFAMQVAGNLLFEGGVEEPSSLVFVYRMAHARFPALVAFLMLPVGIGILLTFGLLVPLGIVSRLERFRFAGWPLLVAVTFVNIFLLHGGFLTLAGALAILGVEVIVLLALFHYFDLLTAYVCVVLTAYMNLLGNIQLLTNMSFELLMPMHGVVLATLAVALLLLRFGKDYSDEDVRPAYARALAERQSLSAQLSTAAVAQAQLTRESVPQLGGFSLAVDCRPARIVSGDYYDFYPLSDRSLGVLMIGGQGRGLLDAMLIAFTKGFLLERAHVSRSSQEILWDLLENLGSLLEPGDKFPELCFVSIDAEKRLASFARTERFPSLVTLHDRGEEPVSVRHGANAEIAISRSLAGRNVSLRGGSLQLDDQTSLLLFTRGFELSLKRSGVIDFREWLRGEWRNLAASDAGVTIQKLTSAALGGTRWQNSVPQEDLTLLVLQRIGTKSEEVEVAA